MTSSRTIIEGLVLDEDGEIEANLVGLLEECMPYLAVAMGHYLDHPALYWNEKVRLADLQDRLWRILEPDSGRGAEYVGEGSGEEGEG